MDTDFVASVLDEIALEGLDGITIESLWLRLSVRPKFSLRLDNASKNFIWSCIVQQDELEFFEINKPRPPVYIFHREDNIDPDTGCWIEPADIPPDINPTTIIKDGKIRGCCDNYHTRKNVTRNIRSNNSACPLEDALSKWGDNRLTIVASQDLRNESLIDSSLDPILPRTLNETLYAVVEHVGRTRYNGDPTRGKCSLAALNDVPKTLFYHCKLLLMKGLIKKQAFVVKDNLNRNTSCRLIQLPRFYTHCVHKFNFMLETLCDYLSEKPNNRDLLKNCRNLLDTDEHVFKKLYQYSRDYLKSTPIYYQDFYPNATEKEYLTKSGHYRQVRVVEMIKRYCSNDIEEDEEEEDDKSIDDCVRPHIKSVTKQYGESYMSQVHKLIKSTGDEGITLKEIHLALDLGFYETRQIVRNFLRLDLIKSFVKDLHKSRIHVYIAAEHVENCKMKKQYSDEKHKILMATKSESNMSCLDNLLNDHQRQNTSIAINDGNTSILSQESSMLDSSELSQDSVVRTESASRLDKTPRIAEDTSTFVTAKYLKRVNCILDVIHHAKLIEKPFILKKVICEKESLEGHTTTIDRRTLFRMLKRLECEGQIKCVRSLIKHNDREKELEFYTDNSIAPTDQIVKSAIEQAKLKYFGPRKKEVNITRLGTSTTESPVPASVEHSIKKLKKFRSSIKKKEMLYDSHAGRRYGLLPKMRKIHVVHEFLWYLVYGYKGCTDGSNIVPGKTYEISDSDVTSPMIFLDEISWRAADVDPQEPSVYLDDTSWRRYVAPLPKHKDYPPGWCLISDVLLLLPISFFCKIINIPYKIEGLEELLDHSTKRYYPITSVSSSITQQLLFARKYIFAFHEVCNLLCQIGLLSFGSHVLKEKDQVFIYLHRCASLVDTRSSEMGYCKTLQPENQTFPEHKYVFYEEDDIEKYWLDFQLFALNTPLGSQKYKPTEPPDEYPNEDIHISIDEARRPKDVDDEFDFGYIPGDGRGAAGLDHSLFSHLQRNWNWSIAETGTNTKTAIFGMKALNFPDSVDNQCGVEQSPVKLTPPKPVKKPKLSQSKKRELRRDSVKMIMKIRTKGNRGGKGIKRKHVDRFPVSLAQTKKRLNELRRKKFKIPQRKRPYHDSTDLEALGFKIKQRVDWTTSQDSLLLLCKVANLILAHERRGMIVQWTVIRDLLHNYCPHISKDKTSHACQRRVAYAMKNPQTQLNVSVFYQEAMLDKKLMKQYKNKKYKPQDKDIEHVFSTLVRSLILKFSASELQTSSLPETLSDLERKNPKYALSPLSSVKTIWKEVTTPKDIYFSVLYNVIHSFVSLNDKTGRSHEMYKLFSQYPEELIVEVFRTMHKDCLVTRFKKDKQYLKESASFLASKPHQLQQKYFYCFHSRYPEGLFQQCMDYMETQWQSFMETEGDVGVQLTNITGGGCAAVLSLLAMGKVMMHTKLPKEILVLDKDMMLVSPVGRGHILENAQKEIEKIFQKPDSDDEEDLELLNKAGSSQLCNEATKNIDSDVEGICRRSDVSMMDTSDLQPIPSTSDADFESDVHALDQSANISKSTSLLATQGGDDALQEMECDFNLNTSSSSMDLPECSLQSGDKQSEELKGQPNSSEDSEKITHMSICGSSIIEIEPTGKRKTKKTEKLPPDVASRAILALARSQTLYGHISTKHVNIQDHFLVKSCEITAFLRPDCENANATAQDFSAAQNLQNFLFISQDQLKSCLKKHQKTLPFSLNMDQFWENLDDAVTMGEYRMMNQIYSFVDKSEEIGVRESHLYENFMHKEDLFLRCFQCLLEQNVIVRVGLKYVRYVTLKHCRPWTIHAYKNTRGRSATSVAFDENDGVKMEGMSDDDRNDGSETEAETNIEECEENMDTEDDTNKINSSNNLSEISCRLRKRGLKRTHSTTEDVVPPRSTYQRIRVICHPWIKPEGSINKPVLKMMTESVMLFVMSFPGVTLDAICAKFNPYLQPVSIKLLLEMLEDLGCVSKMILNKKKPTTLFSSPSVCSFGESDKLENTIICYEPTVESTIRLAHFSSQLAPGAVQQSAKIDG